nr:uncharacterized protein LOC115254519 [Aedes albopictus]
MVFIGYPTQHKGYRFLDRATNRVIIRRDARFLELRNGTEQLEEEPPVPEILVEQHGESVSENEEVIFENREGQLQVNDEHEQSEYDDASEMNDSDFLGFELENPDEQPVLNRADRRTRRELPGRYQDFVVGQVTVDEEPEDYREAMDVSDWKKAMEVEMAQATTAPTAAFRCISLQ